MEGYKINFKHYIYNSENLKTLFCLFRQFYYKNIVNDKRIIKKRFKDKLGRELNLKNPQKYNDKIQWLKLNWFNPKAIICADKYRVRKYVKKNVGKKYLNQIYGIYESVDEINIDNLPKQFVLKGTHGSGFDIICKDKNKINWKKAFKKMKRWLKVNYFWISKEWVYKDIKPRILCERYLEQNKYNELMDYKIFCFNGEPKIIEVDFNRFNNHKRNFYDLNWNFIDLEIEYKNNKNFKIEKPNHLDKMIHISKKLSQNFPHVRIDLYNIKGKIYFGEMTFFHESGFGKFKPKTYEKIMGEWLILPKK